MLCGRMPNAMVLVSGHCIRRRHIRPVRAEYPLPIPRALRSQSLVPEFRPAMEAYFDAILALGRRVLRLLALALDLPPTWCAIAFTFKHQSTELMTWPSDNGRGTQSIINLSLTPKAGDQSSSQAAL